MKKKVLGLHIRGNSNLGDNYCHPLDYFNLGCDLDIEVKKQDVKDPRFEDADYIIFGGGAVARKAPEVRKNYPDSVLIAWGVGYTTRKNVLPVGRDVHYKMRTGYALYGCRDYIKGSGVDYVPCVSCMHPDFDLVPDAKNEIVVYGHGRLGDLSKEAGEISAPYADNMSGLGFAEAINHLASGEVVVTSSYHGAYWATLLGRRVAMVPFGSKFMSLKYRPAVVSDVRSGLSNAVRFDEALQDSRECNVRFYERVRELIWR